MTDKNVYPPQIEVVSTAVDQTERIARAFAGLLHSGDSVGLTGDLGAGKTVFVRGICFGFGYTGNVTSPTFTLMHAYPTAPPIYHFDCFRIRRPQEMITTGFEELISLKEGIILVEWADLIRDYFNEWDFSINLNFAPEAEDRRILTITCREPERVDELARALSAFQPENRA